MIYFTSDLHFGHKNIIKYCNRPFENLYHMETELINRFNSKVQKDDLTYFLGDVSFCGMEVLRSLLSRMNGAKVLVLGNHDKNRDSLLTVGFEQRHMVTCITHHPSNIRFKLCHYPFAGLDRDPKDIRYADRRPSKDDCDWLLHGHVHGAWKVLGNQINVGVDVWDYYPVCFDELIELITQGAKSVE